MLLAALWGVVSVNANAHSVYLRCNIPDNNTSWDNDVDAYKFTFVENDGTQDIYTYTINASSLNKDIYFRFHVDDWDYQFTSNSDTDPDGYSFPFTNGQWCSYELKVHYNNVKNNYGKDRTFTIPHNTQIKASEYKITLYFKGYDLGSDLTIKVDIVSMPATVSSVGYATFSCNRALDFTDVTAPRAYKASVNDGKVVLTKVDGKVAANTGLLLAGASANIPVVPTAEGEDISATNLLKASVTATEVAASGTDGKYHYFLAGTSASDIGFYNVAEAATSGAGKAYLETTTPLMNEGASSARIAWVFQDDETTGIKDATRSLTTNDVFFDLTGRRVKALRGGLYIKNGKKVIVK